MTPAPDRASLRAVVRQRIDAWQAGERPDASCVLAEHPRLAESKSLVLDLVLAEYRLRCAAGETVAKQAYFERFPDYQQSISRLLEVQDFLDRCPAFAEDDQTLQWPNEGDDFAGFRIVEPLGWGGLARVYLAREQATFDRLVVIKVSPLGGREAERLSKIQHPNIMPIHFVLPDVEPGWTVICMPLLGVATGVDVLDRAFARGGSPRDGRVFAEVAHETRPVAPVSVPQIDPEFTAWRVPYAEAVARIGLQLAEGLAAAHAAGILHRDIKPSNIVFEWSGQPRLLDFNLATDDESALQGVGGTLAYMAPERIASLLAGDGPSASRFDPRCDLYSLGAVLYQLLSGRLPAPPANVPRPPPDDALGWLECKRQPIPRLARGPVRVDQDLEAIVLKCLEFQPQRRYATAAELAAELRRYVHVRCGPSLRRAAVRHRREIVVGVLVAATGSILLGTYVGSRPTPLAARYQTALADYERGDYRAAAENFTRCLELKPGWPHALFGRGQSHRMLGRWSEAHADFLALRDVNAGWAYALAGYCDLKAKRFAEAVSEFDTSFKEGMRDIAVLLNHAHALRMRQLPASTTSLYDEVLTIDPRSKLALSNRALAYSVVALRNQSLPHPTAFLDADAYCRLEPHSFEAPFIAAIVYGTAALHSPDHEAQAIARLTEAIQKGMPLAWIENYSKPLKRLLLFVDADVLAAANRNAMSVFDPLPIQAPATTADWVAFHREAARDTRLLAQVD